MNTFGKNPNTNKLEKKISFIKNIPNTNLIIGSGFYPVDLTPSNCSKSKNILEKEYKTRLNGAIAISSLMIIISMF